MCKISRSFADNNGVINKWVWVTVIIFAVYGTTLMRLYSRTDSSRINFVQISFAPQPVSRQHRIPGNQSR